MVKKYKSINDKEYIPFHKEVFYQVIKSEIGKYYYAKVIGEELDVESLLFKEKGRWYWKGHLHDVNRLIEHFNNYQGKQATSNAKNLIKKLKNIDKQRGEDVGPRIIEVLADLVIILPISKLSIKAYQQKVKEARAKLKKLRTAKERFLEKLSDSKEVPKERLITAGKSKESALVKIAATFSKTWVEKEVDELPLGSASPVSLKAKAIKDSGATPV